MSEFGDFNSADPWERYNAHQAAKGRRLMPDPDEVRTRLREEEMNAQRITESDETQPDE